MGSDLGIRYFLIDQKSEDFDFYPSKSTGLFGYNLLLLKTDYC